MNAQKEAEYIAEIVSLKSKLRKSESITYEGIYADNTMLLHMANKCINQISNNAGGLALMTLNDYSLQQMVSSVETTRYVLNCAIIKPI